MRKMLILLALAVLTATSGCSRCRNLFRRGSPCGGTYVGAPAMLGGAIPMGSPTSLQQIPTMVPQSIMAQPGCCQQAAPICGPCQPCPCECGPCEEGCYGEVSGDCGCQSAPAEYFDGYLEGTAPPPSYEGTAIPEGSTTYPQPTN